GDLDWIVLKSLEKDRNRRYETANGLAADVGRHLAGEPVLAAPPSAAYRLKKFLKKHRGPVMAAGLVLLVLLAGIVGTTWGLVEAQSQRDAADAARKAAVSAQQRAMEALRATTDGAIEHLLGARPALGPLEKRFLEGLLQRWQAFAAEQGDG